MTFEDALSIMRENPEVRMRLPIWEPRWRWYVRVTKEGNLVYSTQFYDDEVDTEETLIGLDSVDILSNEWEVIP